VARLDGLSWWQVERHPLLPQWELLEFCASHRIVLQAHTPLGHAHSWLLEHDEMRAVACESGLTAAQIAVQWSLAHGVALVPKCSSLLHARELLAAAHANAAGGSSVGAGVGAGVGGAPVLSSRHMKRLDSLVPPGAAGKRAINPSFMSRPGPSGHLYGW
jgi:hypothetical protein